MATAISTTGHHSLGSMNFGPEETVTLNTSSFRSNQSRSVSPTSPNFPDQKPSRLNSPSATLPDFVFPSRAPNSAPSTLTRATGRRPMSAYELGGGMVERLSDEPDNRRRPAALPDFSFNSTTGSGLQSPQSPDSPHSPYASIPSRAGGHRRGTSELVGGDGVLNSSPTKLAAPSSLGPSAGRKGHSHRRSAAISSHDLTFILKPSTISTVKIGGSAPTSPSEYEHKISPFPGIEDTVTQSTTDVEPGRSTDSSNTPSPTESPRAKMANRNRVGFSDTLEYIPRPLSLVSNDTASTIRGHSVSGSLSSIISAGPSSPTPRDNRSLPSPVTTRPRTASSILDGSRTTDENIAGRRHSANPLVLDLAPSSSPGPATPKWGFFSRSGESSPNRSRPVSAASTEKVIQSVQASSTPSLLDPVQKNVLVGSIEPPVTTSRRASVSSRKSNKKQKKVKSWAGSILSRKSRPRSQKQKSLSRRSPTPPLRPYAQMCEANENLNNHVSHMAPVAEGTITPAKPEVQTDFASWKPRQVRAQDEESMSPIIDLDAALGPFNTPSGYDAEWDASQRGSGQTKRRMHSAGGMGGFMGPGMHYHRRAESAPEMVPFDARFGLHRLGSSSTMADVFEEDEEDDEWEDTKAPSDKGDSSKTEDEDDSGLGIDIKVVDAEDMHADKTMDWTLEEATALQRGVKRKGSGLSESERQVSSSMKSEHSSTSLKDEPIIEESPSPVEDTPGAYLPPRPESGANVSDSTATPPLRARQAKDLTPVDIQPALLSPAFLTPTSPNSTLPSPFPSPRSPFSYDAQRISTAPSSITDEHGGYESLLNGEPGPEYRMSIDDGPSLSSSNSTMTRESLFNMPGHGNPQFRDGQRSASLSSAVVTRKRSSMASLSRLISSSHGERSKLSIESRPVSAIEVDKKEKEKESKSKRISRMMQFWKPKDNA